MRTLYEVAIQALALSHHVHTFCDMAHQWTLLTHSLKPVILPAPTIGLGPPASCDVARCAYSPSPSSRARTSSNQFSTTRISVIGVSSSIPRSTRKRSFASS